MTVKQTNRSHRVAYLIVLLALAVALTTALVLAGEGPASPEKQTATTHHSMIFPAERFMGSHAC